jgi:hypothetical protein
MNDEDEKELRFYKLDEATRFCQVGQYTMKSKRIGKGLYWWVVEDGAGKLITYSRSKGHSALHSHVDAQCKGIEYFVALIRHHYHFTPSKVTFCR